jgi:hypothetical protein
VIGNTTWEQIVEAMDADAPKPGNYGPKGKRKRAALLMEAIDVVKEYWNRLRAKFNRL